MELRKLRVLRNLFQRYSSAPRVLSHLSVFDFCFFFTRVVETSCRDVSDLHSVCARVRVRVRVIVARLSIYQLDPLTTASFHCELRRGLKITAVNCAWLRAAECGTRTDRHPSSSGDRSRERARAVRSIRSTQPTQCVHKPARVSRYLSGDPLDLFVSPSRCTFLPSSLAPPPPLRPVPGS